MGASRSLTVVSQLLHIKGFFGIGQKGVDLLLDEFCVPRGRAKLWDAFNSARGIEALYPGRGSVKIACFLGTI